MKKLLAAYGLWLAGVVSAGVAAWLLYRSRIITADFEAEHTADFADLDAAS